MRDKFLKGAVANGFTLERAQQVFDYIDQFANYGFNRSHAVAYSMLAFQLAYLKCHYPNAFYTALMGTETNLTSFASTSQTLVSSGWLSRGHESISVWNHSPSTTANLLRLADIKECGVTLLPQLSNSAPEVPIRICAIL
ncbi:MAG: hypothetical protein ACLSH6_07400 [Limosilactobacillus pontis]